MPRINYDKSILINKNPNSLLAKIPMSNGSEFFAIRYMPKESKTIYLDENVKIEKIGTLNYKQLTACMDYITKYKITKGDRQYEVFSTILAAEMNEDELYKQAVLEVLLGDENIILSNCDGYIGMINRNDQNGEKTYNINSKYCLSANEIEATVVSEYRKMQEQLKRESNEPEGRDD